MCALQIGKIPIGLVARPFIIAEMSGNHNQSLERAFAITEAAAKAGAAALKLQTFTAESLTLNLHTPEFTITDKESPWFGQTLFDLYEQAATPWDWHAPIMKRAKELGMICFSSPFDEKAVDFLEKLQVPAYKIASFENVHLPLIRKVASTGKPVIISIALASLTEVEEAVNAAREAGCKDLILLKCTNTYPARAEQCNLLTLQDMRERFGCEVGLSDHTLGIGVAVAATALGASVIEKHLTLSRDEGGVDADFSMEPVELAALVTETERAWQSLGAVHYGATDSEKSYIQERRSLYVVHELNAGDVLTPENLRCIRPGYGLAPKHYDALLGQRVNQHVDKGTPMKMELVST